MAGRPKKKKRRQIVIPRGPYLPGPETAEAIEKAAESFGMSTDGIVSPLRRHPSEPVSFRLPKDLIELATQTARANHISRNKLVELVLRNTLKPREVRDERQHDLFA